MNDRDLSKQVASGLFWKFGERIIAQGVSFVISIVLARILLPEEYGLISLVLIFINIANVFVTNGLGEGLIQKQDATETDFSTMFFCGFGFSAVIYLFLFISAPAIASFYNNPDLTNVLRVLSLQVPLSSVKTIQHAYVSKHMMFKKFFFSTLGGTIISGVIGIIMAYNGFGVWSLVEQYLVNSLIDMTVLFITVNWRPKFVFSRESAKSLLSYSWKLLVAGLINTIYAEARNLVIGRVYTESDLAYNTKGNQFPTLIVTNIVASISSVLFPAMAKVNDDMDAVKAVTRRSMKVTSFVIFPMMIGLMAIAEPLVRVLLTDKWLGCVPFLRIACVYWMFQPLLSANAQAINAVGRSDLSLKKEIAKKTIGFGLILATMRISVYVLAISNAIFAMISSIIDIYYTRKVLKYGYRDQFKDVFPALLIALVMGVTVFFLSYIKISPLLQMILQVILGGSIYVGLSYLFKIDSLQYVLALIKKYKKI